MLVQFFRTEISFPNLPVEVAIGEAPPPFVIIDVAGPRPPTWRLAAWVVRRITVEGVPNEFRLPHRRVYYGVQKLRLTDPDFLVTAATIEFSFPYWVRNLTLEIWR